MSTISLPASLPRSARLPWLSTLRAWLAAHPDLTLISIVLVVGGLLRLAFWLRATVFIIADSENYFLPGFQLAHGLGFGLEARRAPLYPVFIAGVVTWIGQDLAALALAQHLLGLATVGLTYALGRLTFGRLAGFVAGLLVALNGSLLISEQTVTTETLFILLLTLTAVVGVLALRSAPLLERGARSHEAAPAGFVWIQRPAGLFLLGGALLGLAALTRPVGLGLLPGLPLALAVARPGWRPFWKGCALYAVGAMLVLLPWMIRNYLTLQVFSTEGAFGQTLVGRTVRHDGFVFVDPSAPPDPDARLQRARELMNAAASRGSFITPLRRRMMQELGIKDEVEVNRLMRDLAVEAILRQPDYYALGTARFFIQLAAGWPERVRDSWESRRDADSREEWESHAEIASLLGPPTPLQESQLRVSERLATLFQPGRWGPPLLGLAAIGLLATLLGARRWRPALLAGLYALALILVGVALVGPVLRYRYPAEPFLALLVGGGLVTIVELARGQLRRRRP